MKKAFFFLFFLFTLSSYSQILPTYQGFFKHHSSSGERQFTNCGKTGKNGPSQSNCNTAYASTDLNGEVTVSGGIQSWTVPYTGTYTITVYGAQGAIGSSSSSKAGGKGAKMSGEFSLTKNDVIKILVGQQGLEGDYMGGGGGGSYVVTSNDTPLIIAGGGGGGMGTSGNSRGHRDGGPGLTGTSGGDSEITPGNFGAAASGSGGGARARGGSNGYGGGGSVAGGGGGFIGNGGKGWGSQVNNIANAGLSFLNGGTGGDISGTRSNRTSSDGGFGGGGASHDSSVSTNGYGGGGGGYSGGGGGNWNGSQSGNGGGGGSYNSGSNQSNVSDINEGHGKVIISW
tara:strand:- start:316 stop:1341 length:1026 start_codon:yes stop_codon:yes gene_type:complete